MSYRIKRFLMHLYLTIARKQVTLALCMELDSMLQRLDHDSDFYNLTLRVYDTYAMKLPSFVLEYYGLWDPREMK